ncbi:MAG TPA: HYR domain-containing protein [Verrucomicrobiae bacterium]|nr:HYR domain-containing protein [Verrucomicrobiae bacterium]
MNKVEFNCGRKQRVSCPATRKDFLAASLGLVFCALWPATGLGQIFTSTGTINFSNGVAAAVPYPSVIYIGTNGAASLPGTIQHLTVTLHGLTCQSPEDLSFMLEAPNGAAFEFLSFAGGTSPADNINLTLDDSASSRVPNTGFLISGTFKPTSFATGAYPSPAPQVYKSAATWGTDSFQSIFENVNPFNLNGAWQLFPANRLLGPAGSISSWSLNFTINPPDLSVSCSHAGNFCQGETGAQYSIIVSNAGPGFTGGSPSVIVADTLPAGLTPTAASGSGWNCVISGQTVTCTQSNQIAGQTAYPPITLTVDVAPNAASLLKNSVTVSGSGDNTTGNDTANDSATVNPPPTVTCSSNITVTAVGYCPVAVNFNFSVSENCSMSSLIATPPSGSAFPVGTNTVTVVATYGSGNTNSCSFNVTVLPGPAPRLAAVLAGTNVVLSWPTNAGCYALQFSPTLSSSLWTTYAGPFATNAGSILVTNSIPVGSGFYRLAY